MPYRNKTYVAFDADNDMHYYRLMQAWKQSDHTEFNFYDAHLLKQARDQSEELTIKRSLRDRILSSKVFVLLVGEKTRYLYKFVRWEIEQALSLDLPIIVVNLNGCRGMDEERCPPVLRDQICMHI
ncbi:MAG: TIR domain-containing protein, partial [bacterium]